MSWTIIIYIKFLHDVACQKITKSASVSQSYSKNKSGTFLLTHGVYSLHGLMAGNLLSDDLLLHAKMADPSVQFDTISPLGIGVLYELTLIFTDFLNYFVYFFAEVDWGGHILVTKDVSFSLALNWHWVNCCSAGLVFQMTGATAWKRHWRNQIMWVTRMQNLLKYSIPGIVNQVWVNHEYWFYRLHNLYLTFWCSSALVCVGVELSLPEDVNIFYAVDMRRSAPLKLVVRRKSDAWHRQSRHDSRPST